MRRVHFWFFLLLLAALACTLDLGGPTPPPTPIGPVENALQEIENAWKKALAGAAQGDGHFTVVLSEAQLTSLLAQEFKGQAPFAFAEPRVYLRHGRIEIYGKVQREHVRARVLLVLVPNTNAAGNCPANCTLRLKEAEFGPWKVPDPFLDTLTSLIQNALVGQAVRHLVHFQVQRIIIQDNAILIEGQLQK